MLLDMRKINIINGTFRFARNSFRTFHDKFIVLLKRIL